MAESEGRFREWLHGALLGGVAAVFILPVAGVGAAASALLAGIFAAYRLHCLARGSVPVRRFWLEVCGWAIAPWLVAMGLTQVVLPIPGFPIYLRLAFAEALRVFALVFVVVIGLRSLVVRFRPLLILEAAVVVTAMAGIVSAHRDGMIARPLFMADWLFGHGLDPVWGFVSLGAVASLLFALVLKRGSGRFLEFGLLAVIAGLVMWGVHLLHPVALPPTTEGAAGEGTSSDGSANPDAPSDRGAGDLPQPGASQSDQPAAVVVFRTEVHPSSGVFYFRQEILSGLEEGRLVLAPGFDDAAHPSAVPESSPPEPLQPRQGQDRKAAKTAPAAPQRIEAATDVALLLPQDRPMGLIDPLQFQPLENPSPARFRRAYRVVSDVLIEPVEGLLGAEPGDRSWPDAWWSHYTKLPKDSRYFDLSTRILGGIRAEFADDPVIQALAVQKHLEQTVTYTMDRPYLGAGDPAALVLFDENRRGYCVHLAHAAAYLLRAMGVPTRISTGYAVPEEQLSGGSALLVKSGDAHAWAEFYVSGTGWVPLEVTPEETEVVPKPFEEQDLQKLLGEMARNTRTAEPPIASGANLGAIFRELGEAIPWVLLGLLALAYVLKWARILAPLVAPDALRLPLAYRAALDRLSASGIRRDFGESRERFGRRLAQEVPAFSALTEAYMAAVFGSLARAGVQVSPRRLSGRVGQEVRKHVAWWRWTLGILDPLSWIRSR
jgi:protein-glutamine gamma-glutamyltransferase